MPALGGRGDARCVNPQPGWLAPRDFSTLGRRCLEPSANPRVYPRGAGRGQVVTDSGPNHRARTRASNDGRGSVVDAPERHFGAGCGCAHSNQISTVPPARRTVWLGESWNPSTSSCGRRAWVDYEAVAASCRAAFSSMEPLTVEEQLRAARSGRRLCSSNRAEVNEVDVGEQSRGRAKRSAPIAGMTGGTTWRRFSVCSTTTQSTGTRPRTRGMASRRWRATRTARLCLLRRRSTSSRVPSSAASRGSSGYGSSSRTRAMRSSSPPTRTAPTRCSTASWPTPTW